ncbi:MAG: hypothetical protein RIQ89_3 [Bacteroidota bacterium]|jgi:membrane fusion protein, adhesin transport system
MLNISEKGINPNKEIYNYSSLKIVEGRDYKEVFKQTFTLLLCMITILLFFPWTQNIRATGNVNALRPDQRPQTIHSVIAGRIEKWYVQEGDQVKKGDTILFISEIKDDYFDPKLLERTEDQVDAKKLSVSSYMEKVKAQDNQISALQRAAVLKKEQAFNKLKQAELKIQMDSIDLIAANTNFNIANDQLARMEELYKKGLKSLTELESRRLKIQEALAKKISQESKLLASRNEYLNSEIELSTIEAEFRDKISKSESEKYAALSSMYDAEASVTKLQNQYSNYAVRTGLYYITSAVDGYITKAINYGIGETIKEGDEIVSIMPAKSDLAVELYIKPIDVPLIEKNQKVRIQFDGWPAIVFSGWPNVSYGTYGGEVVAIDNFMSSNGKFRLLIKPDPEDYPWPKEVRVGAGANAMILLKDVALGYEMWRQINGFPPDYYKNNIK